MKLKQPHPGIELVAPILFFNHFTERVFIFYRVIWLRRDFVLYILPFGLVRLRTFRLVHGLVRRRFSRERREDVSFRDIKIKMPDRGDVNDVMHRKRGLRIFAIWEKAVCWDFASEEEGWLSDLGEDRRLCVLWAPRVGWFESWRYKSSQHRKIVWLSLLCRKTFKLKKVNTSYVLRNRKGFCVSGFLCALWTFYVYFTYSCMAM